LNKVAGVVPQSDGRAEVQGHLDRRAGIDEVPPTIVLLAQRALKRETNASALGQALVWDRQLDAVHRYWGGTAALLIIGMDEPLTSAKAGQQWSQLRRLRETGPALALVDCEELDRVVKLPICVIQEVGAKDPSLGHASSPLHISGGQESRVA